MGATTPRPTLPGCTTAVAPEPALPQVKTAFVSVPNSPFGLAAAPDDGWSFAVLRNSIAVMSDQSFGPHLIRQIPASDPAGLALSHNGRYLLAAVNSGATVIDVSLVERGSPKAVLGTLSSNGSPSAIEVALSANDRYAFASLEYGSEVAVFNLHAAIADDFHGSSLVGMIPLGLAVVGSALSPNGRWLYVTSELGKHTGNQGTLSVINVARAETDPRKSVVSTVAAGCQAVRVTTSANGSVVWVTARASDTLLAFSAAKLISDPKHSLISSVRVGEAPVGLILVRNGARVVVANSNRFGASGAVANLSIVDIAARARRKASTPRHRGVRCVPTGVCARTERQDVAGRQLRLTPARGRERESTAVAPGSGRRPTSPGGQRTPWSTSTFWRNRGILVDDATDS